MKGRNKERGGWSRSRSGRDVGGGVIQDCGG
jgi:hypothetical protein